jgi:hypothetical protein
VAINELVGPVLFKLAGPRRRERAWQREGIRFAFDLSTDHVP